MPNPEAGFPAAEMQLPPEIAEKLREAEAVLARADAYYEESEAIRGRVPAETNRLSANALVEASTSLEQAGNNLWARELHDMLRQYPDLRSRLQPSHANSRRELGHLLDRLG